MTGLPRWSLTDLRARYELEPTLRDIFVEGVFDQDILSCCFRTAPGPRRVIYQIDSVDIPASVLTEHDLSDGNKQRVIALARELADISAAAAFRCLVDKDLDHWFGALEKTPRLIWTKYCSLELYFFSDEILSELLVTTAKSRIDNWKGFIESLTATLKDLYAFRAAARQLGWHMSWLSCDRCLSVDAGSIKFAVDDYAQRLLLSNKRGAQAKQFREAVALWRKKLSSDPRDYIRGHDLVELLAWAVREFKGLRNFASSTAIERLLVLIAPRVPALSETFAE